MSSLNSKLNKINLLNLVWGLQKNYCVELIPASLFFIKLHSQWLTKITLFSYFHLTYFHSLLGAEIFNIQKTLLETFLHSWTYHSLLPSMQSTHVLPQQPTPVEARVTMLTRERPQSAMNQNMPLQISRPSEHFAAFLTRVSLLLLDLPLPQDFRFLPQIQQVSCQCVHVFRFRRNFDKVPQLDEVRIKFGLVLKLF